MVTIINLRIKNPNIIPQTYAYKDYYEKNNKLYDWLSFFDNDEFLEINKKYHIIIFSDTKLLYHENKPKQEKIKQCYYNQINNKHIKSTI